MSKPTPTFELAWDLHLTPSDDRPMTRVALVAKGQPPIVAGDIFGRCSENDIASWRGAEPPVSVLICGWAGNFRALAAIRSGDTVIVKVRELEENAPDGKTDTIEGTIAVPSFATLTVSAVPSSAPLVAVAAYADADTTADREVSAALASHQIQLVATSSKGVTVSVPADRADDARKILRDLIDRDHLAVSVIP